MVRTNDHQPQRTARLCLQPYVPGDARELYAFMRDAQSMRHTYVAPSFEHCASRMATYEAMRRRLGFAPWVVRQIETSDIIGWGGLSVDPEEPAWGLEVSYAFAPEAWGNGYATELVRFSVEFAFGSLLANELRAFARAENVASVRVLTKCGFTFKCYEPSLERNHYRQVRINAA